jgi:hypothetical protein
MTSIHIYDPKAADPATAQLPPMSISVLAATAADVLRDADHLPRPRYVSVSSTQHIGVQFGPDPSSLRTLAQWAELFGGTLISAPHDGEDGPETSCHVEFTYYGVAIEAYAFIPAATASNPERPEKASVQHVSYPHEPGRLHDCPACAAQCHCTPGDAECVYDGPHNAAADT